MTNQQHPITPPPELVREWNQAAIGTHYRYGDGYSEYIATQAAQWGADQELEACCEWLTKRTTSRADADQLRADRRPKPPSLKEQALGDLDGLMSGLDGAGQYSNCAERIRRALEQLDD
jgi:hypothetical protein